MRLLCGPSCFGGRILGCHLCHLSRSGACLGCRRRCAGVLGHLAETHAVAVAIIILRQEAALLLLQLLLMRSFLLQHLLLVSSLQLLELLLMRSFLLPHLLLVSGLQLLELLKLCLTGIVLLQQLLIDGGHLLLHLLLHCERVCSHLPLKLHRHTGNQCSMILLQPAHDVCGSGRCHRRSRRYHRHSR